MRKRNFSSGNSETLKTERAVALKRKKGCLRDISKTILTGTRCARCNGLESTQGKQGRILVVVVVMTTWLRVGVGAKEENKVSRHVPQRPIFI